MSCLRPKKGFWIGYTENGKKKYKIVGYTADHVEKDGEKWQAVNSPEETPGRLISREWIPIPCGKCYGCKLKYARDWTLRLMMEKEQYDDSECVFLTLTYKDEELPQVYSSDELGQARLVPSLRPKDMVLFWKRIRRNVSPCRIFYCGEYGSRSRRPHYHAIVFGLALNDLKVVGKGKNGDPLYNSATLDREWYRTDEHGEKHNLGFIVVGRVTDRSCAYVARYCMKKAYSVPDPYLVPEFIRMSRRPGIGASALAKIHPVMMVDGKEYMTPRFYLKLLEREDPVLAKEYHDRIVELGKTNQRNLSYMIGYDIQGSGKNAARYLDYCRNLEYNYLRQVDIGRVTF